MGCKKRFRIRLYFYADPDPGPPAPWSPIEFGSGARGLKVLTRKFVLKDFGNIFYNRYFCLLDHGTDQCGTGTLVRPKTIL